MTRYDRLTGRAMWPLIQECCETLPKMLRLQSGVSTSSSEAMWPAGTRKEPALVQEALSDAVGRRGLFADNGCASACFEHPIACADRVLSRVELWGCRSVVSTATYRRPHSRQPVRNVRSWIIGRPRLLLRIVGAVIAAMVLVLATGRGYLSFNRERPRALPQPSGSRAVGRTLFDWTDTSRPEPFATQGQPNRELAVWLWYPAALPAGAQPAPYLPRAWADAVGRSQGIAWQDPNSIHATAIADAPFAPTPTAYPVLLLSPGMGRTPADYSALAEDLASHGYVVAGITPTYSADVTVLGDGRIIKSVPAAKLESTTDTTAGNRLLAVWRDDIEFVLGRLAIEASDPGSKLYHRLDTTRVGMLGHSFGGAAAAECLPRRAALRRRPGH